MNYKDFLLTKKNVVPDSGIKVDDNLINGCLFDFQHDIVKWALAKGKSAIFAGTGLGKTYIQLAWSEIIENVMIVSPLAVAQQTAEIAKEMNIAVTICKEPEDMQPGINITNYERIEKFDLSKFKGVVLDESSILKSDFGKIKSDLTERCRNTQFKLCCTATPAPNDYMELGNHTEFLGIMDRKEMLSTFFIHDGSDTSKWRLKHYAVKVFWEWVANWSVMLTNPADLGYDGQKFILPPLITKQITVKTEQLDGFLFPVEAKTLQERQQAKKSSLKERCEACAELVNESNESWLIWCNLNSESELLTKLINDSTEVKGSDSPDHKVNSMKGFSNGTVKKLISKPSLCGFGMNWQHCHNMCFVGLSDSFEQYYQAVRRCWRFGQKQAVNVYFITADTEGAVVSNVQRKEKAFEKMLHEMIITTQKITAKNIRSTYKEITNYNPTMKMIIPKWLGAEK